jgi:hypothetical protein
MPCNKIIRRMMSCIHFGGYVDDAEDFGEVVEHQTIVRHLILLFEGRQENIAGQVASSILVLAPCPVQLLLQAMDRSRKKRFQTEVTTLLGREISALVKVRGV